jgi:hypothetical protein
MKLKISLWISSKIDLKDFPIEICLLKMNYDLKTINETTIKIVQQSLEDFLNILEYAISYHSNISK